MTRTFETFEEGDRPHLLADGVIQEIADEMEVDFLDRGGAIIPGAYNSLVTAVDPARLSGSRLNVREIWSVAEAAHLVQRSGILEPLNRMLWTPEPPTENVPVLVIGGTAHEQDQTSGLVAKLPATTVFAALRSRPMTTPQELAHNKVRDFFNENGSAPTEAQYFNTTIRPQFEDKNHVIIDHRYAIEGDVDTEGVTILERFVLESEPDDALSMRVVYVAGAGLELALKFRLATQEVYRTEEGDMVEPNLSVISATLPLAMTEQQLVKSKTTHQNPYIGLERLVRTAKLLHEATEARELLG